MIAREITINQALVLFGETNEIATINRISGAFFDPGEASGISTSELVNQRALPTFETIPFPTDRKVRNAVTHKLGWLASGASEFRRLHVHLDEMAALVRAEVD